MNPIGWLTVGLLLLSIGLLARFKVGRFVIEAFTVFFSAGTFSGFESTNKLPHYPSNFFILLSTVCFFAAFVVTVLS